MPDPRIITILLPFLLASLPALVQPRSPAPAGGEETVLFTVPGELSFRHPAGWIGEIEHDPDVALPIIRAGGCAFNLETRPVDAGFEGAEFDISPAGTEAFRDALAGKYVEIQEVYYDADGPTPVIGVDMEIHAPPFVDDDLHLRCKMYIFTHGDTGYILICAALPENADALRRGAGCIRDSLAFPEDEEREDNRHAGLYTLPGDITFRYPAHWSPCDYEGDMSIPHAILESRNDTLVLLAVTEDVAPLTDEDVENIRAGMERLLDNVIDGYTAEYTIIPDEASPTPMVHACMTVTPEDDQGAAIVALHWLVFTWRGDGYSIRVRKMDNAAGLNEVDEVFQLLRRTLTFPEA